MLPVLLTLVSFFLALAAFGFAMLSIQHAVTYLARVVFRVTSPKD